MNETNKRIVSKKKVIAIASIAVAIIAIIVGSVFFVAARIRDGRAEEIYGRMQIAFENQDHEAVDSYWGEILQVYGGRMSVRLESARQMSRASIENRFNELTELHDEAQSLFSQGEYSRVLDLLDFIVFVHDVERPVRI
ncbi:MAG: hypothetical protein LBE35_02185 [Clostridiales bacterium]|jgi:hypothetical protein|nr:hypothetical protein [Clostridiales bacterium]